MAFILNVLWNWLKDTQFHKSAASAAAGTSIGIMTVIGILEQKMDTAKAEIKVEVVQLKADLDHIDQFVKARKEVTDERFENIDSNLKYLRGAIDVTNQNILNLSHDLKRNK